MWRTRANKCLAASDERKHPPADVGTFAGVACRSRFAAPRGVRGGAAPWNCEYVPLSHVASAGASPRVVMKVCLAMALGSDTVTRTAVGVGASRQSVGGGVDSSMWGRRVSFFTFGRSVGGGQGFWKVRAMRWHMPSHPNMLVLRALCVQHGREAGGARPLSRGAPAVDTADFGEAVTELRRPPSRSLAGTEAVRVWATATGVGGNDAEVRVVVTVVDVFVPGRGCRWHSRAAGRQTVSCYCTPPPPGVASGMMWGISLPPSASYKSDGSPNLVCRRSPGGNFTMVAVRKA